MKPKPKTLFLIVNWNKKDMLEHCLNSIRTNVLFPNKILVVDNASSDSSIDMLKTQFPEVILLENRANLGFAKANNQGLQYLEKNNLEFEYCVFLNNDAFLPDNSLEALIRHMDENQEVKAAIPSVYLDSQQLQTGVGGYDLSLKSAFNYFFLLSRLFPRFFRGFFIHQNYYRKQGVPLEMDWASGVCFVVKRDVLQKVEGFPEDFFMYAEDVAFCKDIKKFGKIIYFPLAQIQHAKKKEPFDKIGVDWLDSLFKFYRLQARGPGISLRLFLLKLVFAGGFFLRGAGYGVAAIFSKRKENRLKEMGAYGTYTLKKLFGKKTS